MKYPHAHKGVTKIFVGVLFDVIASVLSTVYAVILANKGDKLSALEIVAGILVLVAFILQLVGLSQARKDNRNFGVALWIILFAILGVVTNIVLTLVVSDLTATWYVIVSTVIAAYVSISSLLVVLCVISGISDLADDLGENGYAHRGRIIRFILVCLFLISVILTVVSTIMAGDATAAKVVAWISFGAALVDLFANVWYFIYLARAPRKLSK